jgi:probable HAF family extracellular repeat protein
MAVDIDNSGQIAGTYQDQSGYQYAFAWSASTGTVLVGTLGGSLSIATAIDGTGQIVGQSLDGSGNLHAFLWSSISGISEIGDSNSELATDINDSGEIAYEEDPPPYWYEDGAVGGQSSPSVLDFGGQGSTISAINNSGWIVGYTSSGQGFLWTTSGVIDFGSSFLPDDINDSGEVLGSYQGLPAVWTATGGFQFLDLGSYSEVSATHINDDGQIVGDAATVPEPSALLLCLLGAFFMAAGWRRHKRNEGRRAIAAARPIPGKCSGEVATHLAGSVPR